LWLPLSLLSLVFVAFDAWLVTGGDPAAPPATTLYYDMLAEAFAAGQMHLKATPDPRLAELSNPYDPAEHRAIPRCRQGRTCLFDASYYQGSTTCIGGSRRRCCSPKPPASTRSGTRVSPCSARSRFRFRGCLPGLGGRRFATPPGFLPLLLRGRRSHPWVLDGPIYEQPFCTARRS
jgi:hypothetical protein